jgi:DNA-nicking Smr family endonuclease
MSGRRRRERRLSEAERKLWNSVASTVTPYKAPKLPEAPPEEPRGKAPKAKPGGVRPHTAPPKPSVSLELSPLAKGDPKRIRQVARGRLPIDGILDLHGMRQEEADRAISSFLAHHRALGHRTLLIITGKGGTSGPQSEDGRGVLRRRFLQGIEFGLYGGGIASVRPAHQKHGGRGAFYVLLKAPRDS